MRPPIPDSYWVLPGELLAGEYPGAVSEANAIWRLSQFAAAGVTSFVDVTEEDEGLQPYANLLPHSARWARFPIADGGCPTVETMRSLLDHVDAEVARGEVVYVHCWGGHGRTGTVMGSWLVRHGSTGEAALEQIAELRREVPDADWMASPETSGQRRFVLEWARHDADAALTHAIPTIVAGLENRAEQEGVAALGETKDLQPAVVGALRKTFGEQVWPNAKTAIPNWEKVGNVDVTVRDSATAGGLLAAIELKWGKLDEGVWDLFKMALLSTRPDVAATYLLTGAMQAVWDKGFCTTLFETGEHGAVELCSLRYPTGSKRLVWDWMLAGGHDRFPDFVPPEITTRVVASANVGAAAHLRVVRITAGSGGVPFVDGWPYGNRPDDARRPALTRSE